MTQLELEMSRCAYSAAIHFQAAGELCLQNLRSTGIAATTNLAFACELYLKAALIAEGCAARGHSLSDLFSQLPIGIRTKIVSDYDSFIKEGDPDLPATLNEVGDAFIQSRYIYENETFGIRFGAIRCFAEVMHKWTTAHYAHFERPKISITKR